MAIDAQRVKELFGVALGFTDAPSRSAFLDRECGADADLRRRLDDLLAAHEHPESALERPLGAPAETAPFEGPGESAGAIIAGKYKLLERIGEGGMGEVWVAEQVEPVKRRVALKRIKPGMDSRAVLARFEAERQALALMDHPNIAKVLDAGTTDDGRPFFVMELVKGTPITQFCDERKLSTRERLELFVPVCQAIQHAHQKGIIHRDVKPSNVLVALHDEKPVPKVIDFGVAKAVGQQLTEKTLYTGFGTLVGTPSYMAPEQATFNQLDIDTRADIYSLGVLLYELLAGSPPFEPERLNKAALDEVLRLVREEEPPRPSARLSTSETKASIAAVRQSEPAKLTKLLRGELDWIVMKALEKDRNRRYETAKDFAADAQRYLHDEPVQACPPSAAYRLRKFARRNKRPVLAAFVVILALVVGIIGTTVGLIRARVAETDAAREAAEKTKALTTAETNEQQAKWAQQEAQANLEDAMAAVDQLLTRLGDERLANVPHMEPIRRELLQDALKFYQKFLAKKSDDPVIRREAARAYRRMGEIYFWLGQDSAANEVFPKAIAMMEELGAASSRDPGQRSALVWTHINYSWALGTNPDERVRQRRRAVEVAENFVADFPGLPESRETWLFARNILALALIDRQPDEAEKILQESLQFLDKDVSLEMAHGNLGFLYVSQQRWPEAAQHFRHSLNHMEKILKETPRALWLQRAKGIALHHLAVALAANQQTVEAEECERQAISVFDPLARDYPTGPHYRQDLASAQLGHAGLLKQLHKTAEAEKAYRRAADLYEKLADDFPTMTMFRQSAFDRRIDLSRFLIQAGRPLEAQEMLGKATMVSQKLSDDLAGRLIHKRGLVLSHLELARLLKASGKTPDAQKAFDKAVAIQLALEKDFANKPEFRRELASAHLAAADRLREDGRAGEAEQFYHLVEAHWGQLVTGAPGDVDGTYLNALWALVTNPDAKSPEFTLKMAKKAVALSPTGGPWLTLGWACYRTGDWKAALEAVEKAMPLRNGGDCADWFLLAMVHWKLGDKEKARHWYDKGAQLMEQRSQPDWPRFRAEAAALMSIQE